MMLKVFLTLENSWVYDPLNVSYWYTKDYIEAPKKTIQNFVL